MSRSTALFAALALTLPTSALAQTAPDFLAEQVTASPSALEIGDELHVTAATRNIGQAFTGNVAFTVYLSLDDVWDPGDQAIFDGLVFFPGTEAGLDIDLSFPLAARPGDPQIRPGSYRVIVRLDSAAAHLEPDEVNNAASSASSVAVRGADLLPTLVTTDAFFFIGRTARYEVELENQGEADARNFTFTVYVSDNDIIRVNDIAVHTSPPLTVASGATQRVAGSFTMPTFTSTSCIYFGVIVNHRLETPETNINNNARRVPQCIPLLFPIPNLSAQIVATPTAAAAGESLAVTRLLVNDGPAEAPSFEYAYYLSPDPSITTNDLRLGTFTGSLGTDADHYGVDTVLVPAELSAGTYHLGLIVDPDGVVEEVKEDDNVAEGPQVPVFSAAIQITTPSLPTAIVGVPYEAALYTSGAPLPVTWSVSSGQLPDGLTLDGAAGIIRGEPTTEGYFELTLRASAGTAFTERPFGLRVVSPTVQLRIATRVLPAALAGRDYEAQIVAVGGQVPYRWTEISNLPAGLTLREDGVLLGTPRTPGTFPLVARVVDAVGDAASKELVLDVVSPGQTLRIVQLPLPTGAVDQPYCDPEPIRLEAVDGTEPYAWSLLEEAPAGMTLSPDGELCGVPEVAGRFPLTVRVQDATGLFDTSLLYLEIDAGRVFVISTFSLEDGHEGEPYEAQLVGIRGTEPYTWSVVPGAGMLPGGLILEPSGRLHGTPLETGLYAFAIRATDAQGREDVAPLSLLVHAAPPVIEPEPTGCSCSGGREGPIGALALAGLLGLLGRRRRR